MSDLFDDLNKILKQDLLPLMVKFIKDPNNKITENFNDFLNDPQTLFTDIVEKFSRNKDIHNNQRSYKDIENITDIDPSFDNEYNDLFQRLIVIEENMIELEKILKEKN